MRPGWQLRGLARRAFGPPVRTPAPRGRSGEVPPATAHGVLGLAGRTGEAMLSLGAAAADVTAAIRRIAQAFGIDCHVDLTYTAIVVSFDPGAEAGPPITLLRVVQTRTPDYGRLAAVMELARELGTAPRTTGRPDGDTDARLGRAHARLDAIVDAPHRYRRWHVTGWLSVMAAGVALLLGGGGWVAAIAGATTALIDVAVWWLGRWGLPPFFLQAVGAAIATTVAALLLVLVPVLPVELATLPPSLVVASGIVVLLAGLSLVGAAEDAISGFPVTASGRIFEVLLLTLGIVVGIGAVLDLSRRLGVSLDFVDLPAGGASLAVQLASAAVVAGAWALASYAPPRAALLAAAAGLVAWGVFTVLARAGVGPAVASAAAALVIGFAGESLAGRSGVPSLVTSVCGIVPLLPGLAIYRGLFQLVESDGRAGAGVLFEAALVGLALAAGATLGELLAAPVRLGTRERVRR